MNLIITLMSAVGFEPTKLNAPDLKTGPFDHSGTLTFCADRFYGTFSRVRILSYWQVVFPISHY